MTPYDSIAPPDKADRTPLDAALRDILRALATERNPRPSVTVQVGRDEWERVRSYYQRPYQRRPTREFAVATEAGTVWWELVEEQPVEAFGTRTPCAGGCGAVALDLAPGGVYWCSPRCMEAAHGGGQLAGRQPCIHGIRTTPGEPARCLACASAPPLKPEALEMKAWREAELSKPKWEGAPPLDLVETRLGVPLEALANNPPVEVEVASAGPWKGDGT